MPGILVVEDDENLNRGITFSLKKSGYEVFSAESVKKAKRIASDNNVDVTICDVNLPDGNGLEFIRWMRCNCKWIIALFNIELSYMILLRRGIYHECWKSNIDNPKRASINARTIWVVISCDKTNCFELGK